MTYGFIGLGNMATAIIEGMVASGRFGGCTIYGHNRSEEKTKALAKRLGIVPCASNTELVERSDVIVLAVKPQVMPAVMEEIRKFVTRDKLVISIAAGKETSWYEKYLADGVAVIRIMPNINAKVKAAVSARCCGKSAGEKHVKIADGIFGTVGKVYHIEENMFPAFSAIGGASGAFVLLYIDALAEAGVRAGFSRQLSEELVTGTVLGSAALNMNSEEHPIALMNRICSPGGTTIEGVVKLKELGFETAIQQALKAIIEKDRTL